MKPSRSLALFLGLALNMGGASAQTTLTTYYVIPPTNGCDGIWAFGPYSTMWANCGAAPFQWLFDPMGCVDPQGVNVPLNVVNDTIVMTLCALPCDFELYSADSGLCTTLICGIGPTGTTAPTRPLAISIGPNPVPISSPVLTLHTSNGALQHVQVLDLAGRSLVQATVQGGRAELDLNGVPAGGYLLLMHDGSGHMHTQRFQLE